MGHFVEGKLDHWEKGKAVRRNQDEHASPCHAVKANVVVALCVVLCMLARWVVVTKGALFHLAREAPTSAPDTGSK